MKQMGNNAKQYETINAQKLNKNNDTLTNQTFVFSPKADAQGPRCSSAQANVIDISSTLPANYGVPATGSEQWQPVPGSTLDSCKAMMGTSAGKNGCEVKYAAYSGAGKCHTYCDYNADSTAKHGDPLVSAAWRMAEAHSPVSK